MRGCRWMLFSVALTMQVVPIASCQGPVLVILTTTLPNGVVGGSYSQAISVDGQSGLVWSISTGALPSGLSLSEETGVISGTPTQDGEFGITVTVEAPGLFFRVGQQFLVLDIIPKLTLDSTLETGHQDQAYSDQFQVTGGVTPYTFGLLGHPQGMTFDENTGTLSGTPAGATMGLLLEVTVTDSGDPQQTVTKQTTFVIKPPGVHITNTTPPPSGQVGQPYEWTATAAGGFAPYAWESTGGLFPDGLLLPHDLPSGLGSTGVISGTPTAAGTWAITITVTDDDSPATTDSEEFTIEIEP